MHEDRSKEQSENSVLFVINKEGDSMQSTKDSKGGDKSKPSTKPATTKPSTKPSTKPATTKPNTKPKKP
jgi:hypothetical protein